jgi:hypothetical protein
MRANRIRTALQALGGSGTAQDITRAIGGRPESVSAQLAGMFRRGQVVRSERVMVEVQRYGGGSIRVPAWKWELPC